MASTKLIIQVPCFNEEQHLALTLRELPRQVPGVDAVEVLVIDDGSTDRTSEVARLNGADYILRFSNNLGADIIVNTDGDNQYCAADIEHLIAPVLRGQADMVVGDRDPGNLKHFSRSKRLLQHYGSWVVRTLSGTEVPDTTSGFRAMSREAALQLNVLSDFTYTLETIIQAGKKKLPVTHVPVRTNPERRGSKLFGSVWGYVKRSAATIVRIYAVYEPLKVFSYLGGTLILAGTALGLRFMFFYLTDGGGGHLQSLMLTVLLVIIGFQTILIGLVADLIGSNRTLLEEILLRMRRLESNDKRTDIETVTRVESRRSRLHGGQA
jgi:glycosyltransferase involved in cell wall biosynthesis